MSDCPITAKSQEYISFFLGCPTQDGFVTNIHSLIASEGYFTYIIKGGPGTGKSSLMKLSASSLKELDKPELYFCSSDPGSLDAVIFPRLKVIIIDGTAPHVVEPEYPGASQSIVNLGECWKPELLKESKRDIISATRRNLKYHALVRRYLKVIASLNEDLMSIGENCMNIEKLDSYCERLAQKLLCKKSQKSKTAGETFYKQISSVTPEGVLTLSQSFEGMSIYAVDDALFSVSDRLLKAISKRATECGYDVTVGTSVFHGGKVYKELIIPELKTAFINGKHESAAKINALRFYDKWALKEKKGRILFDRGIAAEFINEAVQALKSAKAVHDELESYYIRAMDFDEVTKRANRLIEEIKTLRA